MGGLTKTFRMQLCMHWGQMLVSEGPHDMADIQFVRQLAYKTRMTSQLKPNHCEVIRVLFAELHTN